MDADDLRRIRGTLKELRLIADSGRHSIREIAARMDSLRPKIEEQRDQIAALNAARQLVES